MHETTSFYKTRHNRLVWSFSNPNVLRTRRRLNKEPETKQTTVQYIPATRQYQHLWTTILAVAIVDGIRGARVECV